MHGELIDVEHLDDPDHPDESALLLTIEEAARLLRIGRTKMCELLATGQVESVMIGRLRRVPHECLHDYITNLLTARPDSGSDQAA